MANEGPGIFNGAQYFGNDGTNQGQDSVNGITKENYLQMDGFFNEDAWPEWPDEGKQTVAQPAAQVQNNVQTQSKPAASINSHIQYEDNFPALPTMAAQPPIKNMPAPPIGNPSAQPPMGTLAWKKTPLGSRRSPYSRQKNLLQGPPSPASTTHPPIVPPPVGGEQASFFEGMPSGGQAINGSQVPYTNQPHQAVLPASQPGASVFESVPPQQLSGTQPPVIPSGLNQAGQPSQPDNAPVPGHLVQGSPSPARQAQPPIVPALVGREQASFFESIPSNSQSTSGAQASCTEQPHPGLPASGQGASVFESDPPHQHSGTLPSGLNQASQQNQPNNTFQPGHQEQPFGAAIFPTSATVQQNDPSWFDGRTSGSPGTTSVEHAFSDRANTNSLFGGTNSGAREGTCAAPAGTHNFPTSTSTGHGTAALFEQTSSGNDGGLFAAPNAPVVMQPTAPEENSTASWFDVHPSNHQTQEMVTAPSTATPPVLPPTTTDKPNAATLFTNCNSRSQAQGSVQQMLTSETAPAVLPPSSTDNWGNMGTSSSFQTSEFPSKDTHNSIVQQPALESFGQGDVPQSNQNLALHEHGNVFPPSTPEVPGSLAEPTHPRMDSQCQLFGVSDMRPASDIFTPMQAGAQPTPPAKASPPFMPTVANTQSTESFFGVDRAAPSIPSNLPTPPEAVQEVGSPADHGSELETLPVQDTPPAQSVNRTPVIEDEDSSPWFVSDSSEEPTTTTSTLFPPAASDTKQQLPKPSGPDAFEPTKPQNGSEQLNSLPQIFNPVVANQAPPLPSGSNSSETTRAASRPDVAGSSSSQMKVTQPEGQPDIATTGPPVGRPMFYNPNAPQPLQQPLEVPPTNPPAFAASQSHTHNPVPIPLQGTKDTPPPNLGWIAKPELNAPPTDPPAFPASQGHTRNPVPTPLSDSQDTPPPNLGRIAKPELSGPPTGPQLFQPDPGQDQTKPALGSLHGLVESPTDTDIYEGSLQKQQKRQKAPGAQAPLSSLWSTGPGAGTPWSSPLLTGPQQAGDKENAQQMPLVGVIPLNLTPSPAQPVSPATAPGSTPPAWAVEQEPKSDVKPASVGDERECKPSASPGVELRAEQDQGQVHEAAVKSGNKPQPEMSDPRAPVAEDLGSNQEQREARLSNQSPVSKEQKVMALHKSLESLMDDPKRSGPRTQEARPAKAAPLEEYKQQTARFNPDVQRAREYNLDGSGGAHVPSQMHGDPRAVYGGGDQEGRRLHPEQYQEREEAHAGPGGGKALPAEELEDSRAEYRQEEHDTRRPAPEQYQERGRAYAAQDMRRGPPEEYSRAAYQREDREGGRPRPDQYQGHEDPRAANYQAGEERPRPRSDENQDYRDQRTAHDDWGRPRPDEYRGGYEGAERSKPRPEGYGDQEAPRDFYDRNRPQPHPGEYRYQDDPRANYEQDARGYGDYREHGGRTDPYYDDQRTAYPQQNTPGGSGTPGSSGRNTPSQYYQHHWQQQQQQGYYPYDPRYQQYYGGYYPGYGPYHQHYAQYYQQYYYPGQYGWGYSPSQSHSSYAGSQVTGDSADGRESRERHHEQDADAAYDSPEPSIHEEEDEEEEQEAGRTTPLLYLTPTPVCKFSPNGKLLVVPPNQPLDGQMAAVKIAQAQVLFTSDETKLMQDYPGPMTRETSKAEVISYTDAMAKTCQLEQRTDAAVMWKVLGLLCKHSGSFVMPEVATVLTTFWERPKPETTSSPEGEEGQEGAAAESSPDQVHDETTKLTMFREMMVVGSRKEALEYATRHHMWGHALLLASRLDARTYNNIVSRFLTTVSEEDPLRSLYQHLFCKLPTAAKTGKDWVAHLATMIANPSSSPESDKGNIITLGDTLNAEGKTVAAHLCYLLAGCSIGKLTDPAAKIVLLGHDHKNLKNEKLFNLECFQMTEIFEYAMRLKKQDDVFPALQMYKYLYCEKLSEAGMYSQALHYLETMAMLIISSPNMFNDNLIKKIMEMSDHLAPYDTEQNYRVAGTEDSEPEWRDMLNKLIKARTDGSYVEDTGNDALGASQAASFFEGYAHQEPSVPLYNNTSQTQDNDRGVPLYDTSRDQGDAGRAIPLYNASQAQGGDEGAVPLYDPTQAPVGQPFGGVDENSALNRDDALSTKSNSTTSFHQQASWSYQPQDPMAAPPTESNDQFASQASYPESYQSGGERSYQEQGRLEQQGQPLHRADSFEFYPQEPGTYGQQPQQEPGTYGQQPQADQMDTVQYQPPAYDPGQMTGQAAWATEPQGEPPSQDTKPKEGGATPSKKSAPKQAAEAGWFSGITGLIKKVIPGGPNEMKLPDDRKKTIYYDADLKRWVNTDEDGEEKAPPPPPPTDFQLGSPGGAPPQPTPPVSTAGQQTPGSLTNTPQLGPRHTGPAPVTTTPQRTVGPGMGRSPLEPQGDTPSSPPSKFSRKAHSGGRGARAKYVDVFKSSSATSTPIAPPSLFQVLPDATPTGFFIPPAPDPIAVEGERKIGNPSSRPSSRAEDEIKRKTSRSSSHSSASGTSAEVESVMNSNQQGYQQQTPMFFDPSQMSNFSAPKSARNVRRY